MSSLKVKAKTTRQIISEYVGTDKWKLDAYIGPDFKPAEKQWVRLVDAENAVTAVRVNNEELALKVIKLTAENKHLKDDLADAEDSISELFISEQNYQTKSSKLEGQVAEAREYISNMLTGHNVSAEFIKNYTNTYGAKDEWINTVYVKELFEILKKAALNPETASKEAKQ